jgi:hypothetical protein
MFGRRVAEGAAAAKARVQDAHAHVLLVSFEAGATPWQPLVAVAEAVKDLAVVYSAGSHKAELYLSNVATFLVAAVLAAMVVNVLAMLATTTEGYGLAVRVRGGLPTTQGGTYRDNAQTLPPLWLVEEMDTNANGRLEYSECAPMFDALDANSDGVMTLQVRKRNVGMGMWLLWFGGLGLWGFGGLGVWVFFFPPARANPCPLIPPWRPCSQSLCW